MESNDRDGTGLIPTMALAQATLLFLVLDVGLTFAALLGFAVDSQLALSLESAGFTVRAFLIVLFLLWLHRAYRNLEALGVPTEEPAWRVVAWWFVPLANLYVPFRRCSEVMWGSATMDADEWDDDDAGLRSWEGTALLLWWVAWIGSGVVSRLADNLDGAALIVIPIALGLEALAAVLLAIFVWRATSRQHDRGAKLGFQPVADPVWSKLALGFWVLSVGVSWVVNLLFGLTGEDLGVVAVVLWCGVWVGSVTVGLALSITGLIHSRTPRGAFTVLAIVLHGGTMVFTVLTLVVFAFSFLLL